MDVWLAFEGALSLWRRCALVPAESAPDCCCSTSSSPASACSRSIRSRWKWVPASFPCVCSLCSWAPGWRCGEERTPRVAPLSGRFGRAEADGRADPGVAGLAPAMARGGVRGSGMGLCARGRNHGARLAAGAGLLSARRTACRRVVSAARGQHVVVDDWHAVVQRSDLADRFLSRSGTRLARRASWHSSFRLSACGCWCWVRSGPRRSIRPMRC